MEKKVKITYLNIVRAMLAFLISIFILFLLLNKINFSDVVQALRASDARLIALVAVISIAINIFWGALKWQKILSYLKSPLTFRESLSIRSAFLSLKAVFPLKSSELLKALYLKQSKSIPFGRGLSSLLLDKGFNLLVTGALFFIGLTIVPLRIPRVIPLLLLAALMVMLFSKRLHVWAAGVAQRLHPALRGFTEQLLSGLTEVSTKEKIILVGYSFVYQLSEFCNTYLLLKASGVPVPFSLVLVLVPLIMIVNNLPITVMGLGTREALIIFLFARYGSEAALLSAGLLVSFFEHILPVIVGLFFVKQIISGSAWKAEAASV